MTPAPTTCDALLEDGGKCPEKVTLTKTHYAYDRKPLIGEPATFKLLNITYHAVCPKCGERTYSEPVSGQA
jgi:hypothetical protein